MNTKYITSVKLVSNCIYKMNGELVEGKPGEILEAFPKPVALKMVRNGVAVLTNGKGPKPKKKAEVEVVEVDGETEEV